MRKILLRNITLLLTLTSAQVCVGAETILQYINACKTQVGMSSSDHVPTVRCDDGFLFAPPAAPGDLTNDFVGHRNINDAVDMVFACRWMRTDDDGIRKAISIEMLLTNRQNGNTCFFAANVADKNVGVAATLPSITDETSDKLTSFWEAPADLNDSNVPETSNKKCVRCHIAGPYIASPRIALYLAQFGLLNNGHDTLPFTINNGNAVLNQPVRYHAIVTPLAYPNVSAFSTWDNDARSYINDFNAITDPGKRASDPQYQPHGCSVGCHSIGGSSPAHDDVTAGNNTTLIPSILSDLVSVFDAGVMIPYGDNSDYRWINLDTPINGVETENLVDANSASNTMVPKLLNNCLAPVAGPTMLEAHVVDSNNTFMIAQQTNLGVFPDRLAVFNAKDGLVCLNSDQEPGHPCQDYKVRYECTDPNNPSQKTWTSWYNMDSPSGDGDHEERSKDANVCTSSPNLIVTGIEAATVPVNGWSYNSYGPNDRLARFSPYGLTCNNADQPDGKCSNYVVRYSGCMPNPTVNKTLTNVYAAGKQLTAASGSLAKGQAHNNSWNTQLWAIEPVTNTEYVRLRSLGTNVYLTVTSTAESATVGTATSNTTTNEMWLLEAVPGASDYRLKNLFSGKYLTIGDPKSFPSTPDYLPVFSQTRNTGWTSQRWLLQ